MNFSVVDQAITSRHSIRAFLPTPISQETIQEILQVASYAPSGTNTQPWRVNVLTGAAKESLSHKIMAVYQNPIELQKLNLEYDYYPREWKQPYLDRRRKVGWDLYGLLDIKKSDKEKMSLQNGRNFLFFDAPVGLIFSLDKAMGQGSLLDYGMFIQNIMVAARARGLDTCAQAAFCTFHALIHAELNIPESEYILCGMALGYADTNKIENTLVTARESVEQFTRFFS